MRKKVILASLVVAQAFASISHASSLNSNGLNASGVRISASGLQTVGSILTLSSAENKTAVGIGWALIIVGSMAQGGDLALGAELYNKDTEISLYGEGQSMDQSAMHSSLKKSLRDVEMEAQMALADSSMSSATTLTEFARSMDVSPERLAQIVVTGKDIADRKLNNEQFSPGHIDMTKADILNSVGPLSDTEMKVMGNYLRLRNINVR
jgi:hypothetical protein